MLYLGIDSSSKAGSVALFQDDRLIWEGYLDCGNTHSCTIMPLVQEGLQFCGKTSMDIAGIYYSAGPGSFTGLRIGAAAVKGLTLGRDIPVKGVSTLLGLSYNLELVEGTVLAVLDARAAQVYAALFSIKDGQVTRLTPDDAMAITALGEILPKGSYVVGDGAELIMNHLGEQLSLKLPPQTYRLQRASSVVKAGRSDEEGYTVGSEAPLYYIRRPQAERDRLEAEKKEK